MVEGSFEAEPTHKSGRPQMWETDTAVVVTRLNNTILIPTFYSPLICRRYTLALRIKIHGETQRLVHRALYLRAPIQVVCSNGHSGPNSASGHSAAPSYEISICGFSGVCNDRTSANGGEQVSKALSNKDTTELNFLPHRYSIHLVIHQSTHERCR